jgi:hypothetical protein
MDSPEPPLPASQFHSFFSKDIIARPFSVFQMYQPNLNSYDRRNTNEIHFQSKPYTVKPS